MQHNQFEQIPLILRTLDPDFLKNDWVVNINAVSPVRHFYSIYMGTLAKILSLPIVYFLNFILTAFITASATYILTQKIFGSPLVSIITAASVLYSQKYTLGGNDLIGRDLDPPRFASGLVILGIAYLLKERLIFAAVIFAAATYIHPLIGFEVPFVAYVSIFATRIFGKNASSDKRVRIRRLLKSTIIYFLLSFFAFIKYFISETASMTKNLSNSDLMAIVTKVRLPAHYSPSTWPVSDYLKFLLFMIFCLLFIRLYRKLIPPLVTRFLLFFSIAVILLSVVNFIFSDIIPVYFLAIGQFFRLTVILYWLFAVVIYGGCFYFPAICQKYKSKIYYAIPVLPFLLINSDILAHPGVTYGIYFVMAILLSLTLYKINIQKNNFIFLLLVLFTLSLQYRHYKITFSQTYPLETSETSLALWVKDHTKAESIFLVPPNFYAFKLTSQRAVVADWLSGPLDDKYIIDWFERLRDVSGLITDKYSQISEEKLIQGYNNMDMPRLNYLRGKYNFAFAVIDKNNKLPLPTIYENQRYIIYDTSSIK